MLIYAHPAHPEISFAAKNHSIKIQLIYTEQCIICFMKTYNNIKICFQIEFTFIMSRKV